MLCRFINILSQGQHLHRKWFKKARQIYTILANLIGQQQQDLAYDARLLNASLLYTHLQTSDFWYIFVMHRLKNDGNQLPERRFFSMMYDVIVICIHITYSPATDVGDIRVLKLHELIKHLLSSQKPCIPFSAPFRINWKINSFFWKTNFPHVLRCWSVGRWFVRRPVSVFHFAIMF